jgi:IPT/TIG domain
MRRVGFLGRRDTQPDRTTLRCRRPAAVLALILGAGGGGLLGTVVVLPTPAGATATTLYVAASADGGSDSNDCSQAAPCASISHTITVATSGDTISVGSGTFLDSVTVPASFDLTVQGAGTAQTTLQDTPSSNTQLFTVDAGATLSLSALDVTGASGSPSVLYANDGEIDASGITADSSTEFIATAGGSLDVTDSTLSQGSAMESGSELSASNDILESGASIVNNFFGAGTATISDITCSGGGRIGSDGSTMTVLNFDSTDCEAQGDSGTLTISDSSFSDPSGSIYGEGGDINVIGTALSNGAGVDNQQGTTTIENSTVTGGADIYGGGNGIGDGPTGPVTTVVENSTLSDVEVFGIGGTTSISDSTVAHDTPDGNDNALVDGLDAPVSLFGDIVDAHCQDSITDDGFNLDFGDSGANSCGFASAQNDVVEQDPQLGPLQDNGGPTLTQAITSASPAYHVIPVAQCPTTDQRGIARPQPSNSPTCDIGAFEASGETAPTVTSLSPSSGPTNGGTSVTVSGTGFTGATAVVFGGIPGKSVTVLSDTTLSVISPANSAGAHSVQVETPSGTSPKVAAAAFTYVGAPTVTGLSPSSGPQSGGTLVTVSGTGFTGASSVLFGGYPGTNVTVVNDTTITVNSPGNTSGVHSVQVSTPQGTSAKVTAGGFTYTSTPTVTGLSPGSGPRSGGTTVTVTGTGFTGATSVTFGGYPGTNVTVVNDTTITVTSSGNTAGVHSVQVTTPAGTSAKVPASGFNYVSAPTVTGLSPTSGPRSGGTFVTLTGTGFTGATSVTFGGYPGTNVTVVNDTTITVTSSGNTAGVHSVQVTTPGGTSAKVAAAGFTYS